MTRRRELLLPLLLPHQLQRLQLLLQFQLLLRLLLQLLRPILVLHLHKRLLPLLDPHLWHRTSQVHTLLPRTLSTSHRTTRRGHNHNLHPLSHLRHPQRQRQLLPVQVVAILTLSARRSRILRRLQRIVPHKLFRRETIIAPVLRRRSPASLIRLLKHNPYILSRLAPPPAMCRPSPRRRRRLWRIHLHIPR